MDVLISNGRVLAIGNDLQVGDDVQIIDAKGLVVKITKSGWCDGEEFEDVETFEYKKFDAKGNWTSRVLTSKSVTDPNSKPYVAEENRRIGYYK